MGLKAIEESQKIAVKHNLSGVPTNDIERFNDLDEFRFYPVSSYEIVSSFPPNKAPGINKVSFIRKRHVRYISSTVSISQV